MIWTETYDDQLFVYWNGQLVFKRWLKTTCNVVLNPGFPAEFFWDEDWKWDNKRYWEKQR